MEFNSFDEIFNTTTSDKIIVNDINIFNNDYREMLNSLIVKNYTEDTISLIPSCQCGYTQGTYYIGEQCIKCNTVVMENIADSINYLIWAKRPETVEKFISPFVLSLLEEKKIKLNKVSIDLVKWLIQPSYRYSKHITPATELEIIILSFLKQHKIERTYNSFIINFDKIMIFMNEVHNKLEPKKSKVNNYFFSSILENKDKIFSEVLPFPNKVIFAYESNELGKFVDKSIMGPLNSIRRLSGIDSRTSTSLSKQTKVANSLYDLVTFYRGYLKNNIFSKPGLVRQHMLSTRAHFTARAVITNLTETHEYDEIHIPWAIGISLFREHILNKLNKRGFTYKQSISLLFAYTRIYNPLLDDVFKELIAESGNGIRVFFNRNPSLTRSSIQTCRITRVKPDIHDNTISLSILIAAGFNAD